MTQTQFIRRIVKPIVFAAALGPFGWLVYNAFWGDLGVNPVETITNYSGITTLRLIAITLALTPARWISGFNPIILFRRMIGLFAFFYGTLHFMTYFILDQSLQFGGVWDDVVKRPYITAGFTGFVLMIPLAITSTQGWIRRLGGRRWNLLHRLIYITALAAVLHYFWKVKLDTTYPVYYGILMGVLLTARLVQRGRKMAAVPPRRAVPIRREA
ncbi:MAG TPA: protein-methionine-sulfoxide reductase heme-binding subunit MsrQ [Vicinamibacterales bacterium]|nr:protein-methionine-sulfoxide reductase heme-binding subunit MsrQ [Vicinamibacterales bacterium]